MTTSADYSIRLEREADFEKVEFLIREAFWNVYRPGCFEHYLARQLRSADAFIPELSFVLEKDGEIIGQIMYVRSQIALSDGTTLPIATFGPLSVAPDYRRRGYGSALTRRSMEEAAKLGAGALAITGAPEFYARFGFESGRSRNVVYADAPDAPYFLVKELKPGFLNGVRGTFRDPACYLVSEAEAELFDRQFPPKEKLKLPGQLV
ncbi:MAG: N-acetyltransferase [Thermoguttaceae bacterium]|nr:N-acetyltransferase [Thermoguttaceae bacterium]MBQ9128138.1 N-acetyltransferase [Thermoguttaceae bacterium]